MNINCAEYSKKRNCVEKSREKNYSRFIFHCAEFVRNRQNNMRKEKISTHKHKLLNEISANQHTEARYKKPTNQIHENA